ncbi:NAD(P)/FAD-dependent oxidoreductase [Paraferrimonas haliotis]|uniref:HI0933 family flavoprotein YhiN n=1 Tax=Paraferrimonas haliotis TaxID=2013866 RepID=A0AA37TIP1_9GAMM|nr:NAD(P)/FAD-dependent oxidoreductase [Paraferrimonas haliotis]GLS82057.1 HI0933 family flavoprotein YhiN [Paraferrimonas haliotis]
MTRSTQPTEFDVIIIGAGAAGLMCASTAGYRSKRVLVLDNAKKAGRKILIAGGGKCNFTNVKVEPQHFICNNPHFVKSALARYPSSDFIELVERHGIDYEERDHGQLFCQHSAKDIVDMLLTECEWAQVDIRLRHEIIEIERHNSGFTLATNQGDFSCASLVIASGGLSMPKLGATPFGYKLAEQFGISVAPTRAGLVPFTLHDHDKQRFEPLSGVSLPVEVSAQNGVKFVRDLLFTHRGLSGPAALQISNYWQPGESLSINFLPETDALSLLEQLSIKKPKQSLKNALARVLPKRLVETIIDDSALQDTALNQLSNAQKALIEQCVHAFQFKPNATEGYRTAEVTLGGVNTDELSSKTMEAKQVAGLYFIGEVVDVTGWLGGFNFQWAWSSAVACGLGVR